MSCKVTCDSHGNGEAGVRDSFRKEGKAGAEGPGRTGRHFLLSFAHSGPGQPPLPPPRALPRQSSEGEILTQKAREELTIPHHRGAWASARSGATRRDAGRRTPRGTALVSGQRTADQLGDLEQVAPSQPLSGLVCKRG